MPTTWPKIRWQSTSNQRSPFRRHDRAWEFCRGMRAWKLIALFSLMCLVGRLVSVGLSRVGLCRDGCCESS